MGRESEKAKKAWDWDENEGEEGIRLVGAPQTMMQCKGVQQGRQESLSQSWLLEESGICLEWFWLSSLPYSVISREQPRGSMTLAQTQLWVVGDFQSPAAGALRQLHTHKWKPEQSYGCHKLFLFSFSLSFGWFLFWGSRVTVFKKNSYYILVASRKGKEMGQCSSIFIFSIIWTNFLQNLIYFYLKKSLK